MEENWHSLGIKKAGELLETDLSKGLDSEEAEIRQKRYGQNKLVEEKKLSFLSVALNEIREPMILLLLVVGVIYSIWGELRDAITIFSVILVLVFLEVYTEFRAIKSIAALKKLTEPNVTVVRDSKYKEIAVADLVPGDIIMLKMGQRVPADARLVESYGLKANESSLTGESVLVEKDASVVADAKAQVAERKNMIFAGSVISQGRGKAVVVSTGMRTELGKITKMVQEAKVERTPLQKLMKELTKWMVWVALFFSIIIPLLGFLRGQPLKQMVLTGLALSFSTIPEELPIVITMVLALGSFALSKSNALVKNLGAAETLGSVTVICADKTGTLTENKMSVSKVFSDGKLNDFSRHDKGARSLLEASVLCNDVLVKDNNVFVGDPTQIAGLNAAVESGIGINQVRKKYGKLLDEFSFDSSRKLMSVVYAGSRANYVFATGAPEILISKCNKIIVQGREKKLTPYDKKVIRNAIDEMSRNSLRVVAFACKKTKASRLSQNSAESGLAFIGMFGIIDPPRKGVEKAVEECRDAGIRVIMITGDHADTAREIAKRVGIDGAKVVTGEELDRMSEKKLLETVRTVSVYARISPEHKLKIVNALKKNREIVAVTGDGINDAPALSNAHIGIAMGETGTDVAREASSMVLADDNFMTIAKAVREGRKIFDNLKKGIRYYLSCKIALVIIFLMPVLFGLALPLAPIQIIILELFMDAAASTGFSIEPAESDIMMRKPRDTQEKFLNRKMVSSIFISALCLIAAVLFSYFWSIHSGAGVLKAQTIAFATWIVGHIFLAINMRSEREPIYKLGIFSNKIIIVWAVAAVGLLLLAANVPYLEAVLKTASLSAGEWGWILLVSFVATFWMEAKKIVKRMY